MSSTQPLEAVETVGAALAAEALGRGGVGGAGGQPRPGGEQLFEYVEGAHAVFGGGGQVGA